MILIVYLFLYIVAFNKGMKKQDNGLVQVVIVAMSMVRIFVVIKPIKKR